MSPFSHPLTCAVVAIIIVYIFIRWQSERRTKHGQCVRCGTDIAPEETHLTLVDRDNYGPMCASCSKTTIRGRVAGRCFVLIGAIAQCYILSEKTRDVIEASDPGISWSDVLASIAPDLLIFALFTIVFFVEFQAAKRERAVNISSRNHSGDQDAV